MSILGVKKKHVDTSEIEKEISNMKSEILKMDTKDKYLYSSVNTLNLRVLNIENIVTTIRDKPDRKIISIFAGISGPVQDDQLFYFGNGGGDYVMNFPGQILGISLTSLKTNKDDVSVLVMVNSDTKNSYGINLNNSFSNNVNFAVPLKVEAGDKISFISNSRNISCINTLVSAVIELFL